MKDSNAPGQKADNPILALHGAFNQQQPGAADGMAMAAEDVRPDGGKVLAIYNGRRLLGLTD